METFLVVTTAGWKHGEAVSIWWRPGILLNILSYIGQLLHKKELSCSKQIIVY
jgi:hypothetical protein